MHNREKIDTIVRSYLEKLCGIIQEKAIIEIEDRSGSNLNVNLRGIKSFSGENQELLKSLGYILELYVKRECNEKVRIYIDVNSYKAKRREKLGRLAKKVAQKVTEEHKRMRLKPMKAYERKAVHVALADFPGVRTRSVGKGLSRRVIIEPAHDYEASP